jgi:hypothetical protein
MWFDNSLHFSDFKVTNLIIYYNRATDRGFFSSQFKLYSSLVAFQFRGCLCLTKDLSILT